MAELVAGGPAPGLATILVGDDPASHVYVRKKRKDCEEVGMRSIHHELPADAAQAELAELIESLNADPAVHGHPAPASGAAQLDDDALTGADRPAQGRGRPDPDQRRACCPRDARRSSPCTPLGRDGAARARPGVELEGAEAVVDRALDARRQAARPAAAGRQRHRHHCHSRTRDLAAVCREADVLVAAVGLPRLVTADMVKEGAVVIDVGINRVDEGLVGDVDFDAVKEKAARDHAGARRRRADDARDAAGEHPAAARLQAALRCNPWTSTDCDSATGCWPSAASPSSS